MRRRAHINILPAAIAAPGQRSLFNKLIESWHAYSPHSGTLQAQARGMGQGCQLLINCPIRMVWSRSSHVLFVSSITIPSTSAITGGRQARTEADLRKPSESYCGAHKSKIKHKAAVYS